ncbi:MAG: M48 family metallopeptidase [Thiotrichales bacterium]
MNYRRSHYRGGYSGSPTRGFSLRWLPILLFAGYFAYYYFAHQEQVPLTGRSQLVDMNRQEEMQLGLQSYQEILRESKVVKGGREVERVREIGDRLAAAAKVDDPGFDWEFNLIQSDQVNAFCLPGGKVAVYTGLLPVAKNDDGLAVVMGHEIAHAIARHGAERMAHQKLVQFGTMAAGAMIGDMDIGMQRAVMGALGVGSRYGVLLPFSRQHESEADYIGLLYMARACYDPREAPELWARMNEKSGGSATEFASTHPSPQTRIAQFRSWMPEAIKAYEQHCDTPLRAR